VGYERPRANPWLQPRHSHYWTPHLEKLAYAQTVGNGNPIRETLNADIPLTIEHFRYFAGCLRPRKAL
jgi:acyl-CoA reductase-like NAD-dependent aldehyde dehydrogenase